jgi:hypothetical protein
MLNNNTNLIETIQLNYAKPDFFKEGFLNLLRYIIPGYKPTISKYIASFFAVDQKLVTGLQTVRFYGPTFIYPESEDFIAFGIRVLSGTNAALGSTDWVPGVTDAIAKNGRLDLNNNGSVELKQIPMTAFTPSANNADVNAGTLMFMKPVALKSQTEFYIDVTFPTVVATANHNLRFELIGQKLI